MSTQICNPCADGKVCIEGLDNYSLQDDTYYFVLNCLPNVYCGGASTIYLVCCDGTTMQQTIPQGSTVARRNALIADLVSRCARLTTFCAGGDGGDHPPGTNVPNDGTDPNNPVPYYGNYPKGWTVRCPDGNPYTFTVPAGMFIARTQAAADAAAQLWAKQVATVSKICVSAPQRVCCNGVAYSSTVVASGGPISAGGGTSNFTWAILGTLPTGLTAVPFGHNALRISGIPTTNGTYSFTIRAVDSTGAYMNKPTSIRVWGITDTSLPDATEGSNYTHQLTTTSGTAPYTYTLVSGGFPLGITLSSTGLIDGLAGEAGAFTSVIRVRDANGATCSKELTLTSTGCDLETCADEADLMDLTAEIDSPKTDIFAAYSSKHCYVCVAAYDPNIDGLRFWKYLPDNTLTLIGQTAGGVSGTYVSIVYDPDSETFLAPAADKIWKIDPVTDAVTSFGSGGWAITRADARGQIFACTGTFVIPGVPPTTGSYISRIDGVAETVTQIGSVVKIPSHLVYSPESDCLYGDWDTGISEGMVKFNLGTNTDTNIVSAGCQNLCWDSDRNLLVSCGYTMSEWQTDTILDVQVYTNYFAAGGPAFQPVYISGMKRVYGGQYGSGSDYLIMEYDTENQTTGVTISTPTTIDYDCLIELKDGSVLALINDYTSYVPGVRKLCLTGCYAYFKCDEVAGTGIADSVHGITLTKSTIAFPTETGFIGTSVRTGAYPVDPFFKAANFYTQLADASHWDFSTSSWTIRMWVKIINGTENVWLASALSTPDQFRMLWLSTGNVELTALLGAGWETITVPMASGAWHRIIAYYEKGVGIGLMVDDGLPTLGINTNLIGSGNQRLLIGGPLGYGVAPVAYGNIDEVAIWKRLLTADEIIYDWNSGAGKTYPDIP